LEKFEKNGLQLIWQTGKTFVDQARNLAAGKSNIRVNDFITKMEYAYAAADIVVSRSGAMAIAELCVVKKPVILVPYPFSAEDHQTVNAMKLVDRQAGLFVTDKEANNKLVQTVIALAGDPGKQESLRNNIATLAITDADEVIAKEILRSTKVLLNDGE
ncbi:MAG: UDP-N-acetylglucosamine--N-acetylmuramyl-(pentapeptide) pyrophosphoryl-undecaprenol N-acetylglucosamine transferase, partial [Chitinophagaceae bacterium]